MKAPRLVWILLLFLEAARAQSSTAYVFVAPGSEAAAGDPSSKVASYSVGGGAQRVYGAKSWLFVGPMVDIQGIVPGKGEASSTVGVLSIGGVAHFRMPDKLPNFDPFVTAGYALIFNDFTSNGFDFGGGVNYWIRDGLALRVEFREQAAQIPIEPYIHTGPYIHFWGVRLGVTFGHRPGS